MRDFERSDERIREEVCSRICEHPAVDTSEMRVMVEHGEVTLEGSVDDRFEKRLAEDLAASVPGVQDVHNRLRTNGHHERASVEIDTTELKRNLR
jgi:osmotically-inducible protein OsmY